MLGGGIGLIVADWDTARAYRVWRDGVGYTVKTLTERTERGYHLFFTGEDLPSVAGDGCEFKTFGVCTVSPSVHPSGVVYYILKDVPIMRIDEKTARTLFPFLSETARSTLRTDPCDVSGVARGKQKTEKNGRGSVIARVKEERSIVAEMDAAGIELRRGGRNTLVGLCPFHDDHSPSLWVYPHSGLWGCNKPSCSAAGIHDVINLRALVRGISNAAAIKQLASECL